MMILEIEERPNPLVRILKLIGQALIWLVRLLKPRRDAS
jgi:hypothetical protein